MRKIVLTLAILLLATSAMAEVRVIVEDVGGEAVISYETDGEAVRAFALDITVSAGSITGISDYLIGESIDPNLGYGIFPASFRNNVTLDPNGDPNWNDPNYSPLADPCDPGALGDLGDSSITIELGSLYYPSEDGSPNAPGDGGTLCTLTVSECCNMTVTENEIRGGVVLTDANAADVNFAGATAVPVYCVVDCFPSDHPDYQEWVDVGKPDCWCYRRQCYGDADGLKEGSEKKGYYYVHFGDLNVLLAGWDTKEPPHGPGIDTVTGPEPENVPGICADFAHDKEGSEKKGYYRVHFSDLNLLIANWNTKEPPLGPGVPDDCGGTLEPE